MVKLNATDRKRCRERLHRKKDLFLPVLFYLFLYS
jgi:hypothetical protein